MPSSAWNVRCLPFGFITRAGVVGCQSVVERINLWNNHQIILIVRTIGSSVPEKAAYKHRSERDRHRQPHIV